MYTQGVRESELRRALEKAHPAILAAMGRVTDLVRRGVAAEAVAAALDAAEENSQQEEGVPLSGPYRSTSLQRLGETVRDMTLAAEAEGVPGPAEGWKVWRERFLIVADGGDVDAQWEAEDAVAEAAEAETKKAEAAAAAAAAAAAMEATERS